MRSVFLSCHFGDADHELIGQVVGLLESHYLRPSTGEEVGGGALTVEVMQKISESDALVALMTKRSEPPDYGGTHPWVVQEFLHAQSLKRPAIAVVFPGVSVVGAYKENERIDYDPKTPLKAFLKLSKTIGLWKAKAGRLVKVQVLPEQVADEIAAGNGAASCKYRLYRYDGTPSEWYDARAVQEGNGTYVYLKGVTDETLIQLRAEISGSIWSSPALPQSIPVSLKKK